MQLVNDWSVPHLVAWFSSCSSYIFVGFFPILGTLLILDWRKDLAVISRTCLSSVLPAQLFLKVCSRTCGCSLRVIPVFLFSSLLMLTDTLHYVDFARFNLLAFFSKLSWP